MKSANRAGALYALVLGEQELESGQVAVKDLSAASQEEVSIGSVVTELQRRLDERG